MEEKIREIVKEIRGIAQSYKYRHLSEAWLMVEYFINKSCFIPEALLSFGKCLTAVDRKLGEKRIALLETKEVKSLSKEEQKSLRVVFALQVMVHLPIYASTFYNRESILLPLLGEVETAGDVQELEEAENGD